MADQEAKTPDSASSTDAAAQQIQNLKGEFNRKLDSVMQSNQELLSRLEQLSKPAQATSTDDTAELFEKPQQFVQKLKNEILSGVDQRINSVQQATVETNQTLASLYDQYPELANPNSELTKKALEQLKTMTPQEQRNPKFMKVAALEAAAELGITPKKLRKQDDEPDVAFNTDRRYVSNERPQNRSMRQAEADMMQLAEYMGVNVNDKAVAERLKGRLKRMAK